MESVGGVIALGLLGVDSGDVAECSSCWWDSPREGRRGCAPQPVPPDWLSTRAFALTVLAGATMSGGNEISSM